jgi:hypothetical protein
MKVKPGDIVVIKSYNEAFKESPLASELEGWEEHFFLVDEVYDDLVTGRSISGVLSGTYGEPDFTLIKKVYSEKTSN